MPESVTQFLALAESIIRSVKEQQHTHKYPLAYHHFRGININRFFIFSPSNNAKRRVKTHQFSPSTDWISPAGRAHVVAHPRNSHGTNRRPNSVVFQRDHLLPGWTTGRHHKIERLSSCSNCFFWPFLLPMPLLCYIYICIMCVRAMVKSHGVGDMVIHRPI